MSEQNKTVELTEKDLEKVSGGTYKQSNTKPIGFSFYINGSKNDVLKVSSYINFVNVEDGSLYKIDHYCNGVYRGNYTNLTDREIDDYVSVFGKPE